MLQVRDYIHVVDLADGHIAALKKLFNSKSIGVHKISSDMLVNVILYIPYILNINIDSKL